jgi:hypothetical protein
MDPIAVLISAFPVVGMSAKMHYCKDENLVLLDTVDNAIRETVYKAAPDALFDDGPCNWVGGNILDSSEHLN